MLWVLLRLIVLRNRSVSQEFRRDSYSTALVTSEELRAERTKALQSQNLSESPIPIWDNLPPQ
jgi:hypothetical protein